MLALFFETTSKNLLLGFMPESLGLLIFGGGLIALTIGLRRIFDRNQQIESEDFPADIHETVN